MEEHKISSHQQEGSGVPAERVPHHSGMVHGSHHAPKRWDAVPLALAIVLVLALSFSLYLVATTKAPVPVVQEAPALPKVELTLITAKCDGCLDVAKIAASARAALNVTSEREIAGDTVAAAELIGKYNISRLPTIILTGEIDKARAEGLVRVDDALVLASVPAPFVDAETMTIKGVVDSTVLSVKSCSECQDVSKVVSQLKQLGVRFGKETVVDVNTEEGKTLVAKYNISAAPTIIFSSDAQWYDAIAQPMAEAGSRESDGAFVWRVLPAPYFELSSGKTRGMIDLILVNDSSCAGCYDVAVHRSILVGNFGMFIRNESVVDAASPAGKSLVKKYDIEGAPTAIVSGDVAAYPVFVDSWKGVGDVIDGVYVFRNVGLLGLPYRNLTSGQFVNATTTG